MYISVFNVILPNKNKIEILISNNCKTHGKTLLSNHKGAHIFNYSAILQLKKNGNKKFSGNLKIIKVLT